MMVLLTARHGRCYVALQPDNDKLGTARARCGEAVNRRQITPPTSANSEADSSVFYPSLKSEISRLFLNGLNKHIHQKSTEHVLVLFLFPRLSDMSAPYFVFPPEVKNERRPGTHIVKQTYKCTSSSPSGNDNLPPVRCQAAFHGTIH